MFLESHGLTEMTIARIKQKPVRLGARRKHDVRTQFGALCWRRHEDGVRIALITSRGRRRWGLPKGWPMDGTTPARAAAREAYEEAGLEGVVDNLCIGIYSYTKSPGRKKARLPCVVALFPLEVTRCRDRWPERGKRKRRWASPEEAATLVDNPELSRILREFDPDALPPHVSVAGN